MLRSRSSSLDATIQDVGAHTQGAFESLEAYKELLGNLNCEEMYAVAAEAIDGNKRNYIKPPMQAAALAGMANGTLGLEETLSFYFLWWNYEEYLWKTRSSIHRYTCLDLATKSKAEDEKDRFNGRAYEMVRSLFNSTPEEVIQMLFVSTSTLAIAAKWADRHDHALDLIPRPVAASELSHFGPTTMTDEEAARRAELWRLYLFYLKVVKHSLNFVPPEPEKYSDFFDYRCQLSSEAQYAKQQFRMFGKLAQEIQPGRKIREFNDAWVVCRRAFQLL